MKRSEIFNVVLGVVSDCTEVEVSEICSNTRTEDAVTARCLVSAYCAEYGLLNKHIQEYLHLRSHSSIGYYLNMFANRKKTDRHFRFMAACVGHELDKMMPPAGQ